MIILLGSAGTAGRPETRAFLENFIRSRGIQPRIVPISSTAEAASGARDAIERGEALIIAGGDDAIVSAAAGVIAGTRAALGVLPLGRLNRFARDAGIPLDLEAATRTAMTGRIIQADVGEVNSRTFINFLSLGFSPAARVVREHAGWTPFASATAFLRPPALTVRLDQSAKLITAPFVFVGNNQFRFKPPHFDGREGLNAGRLWVCAAPRTGLARLSAGKEEFFQTTTAELWIEGDRKRLRVTLDGERMSMFLPLHFRVRARALRLIVPELD